MPTSYSPIREDTHYPPFHVIEGYRQAEEGRRISRTPSPTPSELKELNTNGMFNFRRLITKEFWFRRKTLIVVLITCVVIAIEVLIQHYNSQITNGIKPAILWMHRTPGGFVICTAVIFVLSFPPLFGGSIVGVLAGLVWGLLPGLAIVAVGTMLGEIANFYVFRYCFRSWCEKIEKSKLSFEIFGRAIRKGGFRIALAARYSAFPSHFTTAIFATCGMGFWTFFWAAMLSLPNDLINVILGYLLFTGKTKEVDVLNVVVLIFSIVTTWLAMWYLGKKTNKVKIAVIHERRKARQGQMEEHTIEDPYSQVPTNPAYMKSTNNVSGFESESMPFNTQQLYDPVRPEPIRPSEVIADSSSSSRLPRPNTKTSWDQNPKYQPGSAGYSSPTREQAPYAFK